MCPAACVSGLLGGEGSLLFARYVGGMARIGVYGGSFDPVHHGHLAIARAAVDRAGLDRLLFVPARRNPLKPDAPVAGDEDRCRMLELAVMGEPRFEVCRLELERPGPSYTVETLETLSPLGELSLVMGSDAARGFEAWHRADRIRALARILVAVRAGEPPLELPPGFGRLDAPLIEISASGVRGWCAAGGSLRYLVPDSVREHIEVRGLYRP